MDAYSKIEVLIAGICIGMFVMGFICGYGRRAYDRILVLKGTEKHKTAEKLADGRFYYIVPEAEYTDLKIKASQMGRFIAVNKVVRDAAGQAATFNAPPVQNIHQSGCGDPLCGADDYHDGH